MESARILQGSLESDFWHACAGEMVQMPQRKSKVLYFPQGHAEHIKGDANYSIINIAPYFLCSISDIKYLADPETDEVYAKIILNPVLGLGLEDDEHISEISIPTEKPKYFVKALTQSDANNSGGLFVPRDCADSIFPPLDSTLETPVQNIVMKDVHGKKWKFRHIFRGKPLRHLLTTGWSTFVNSKHLVAGDYIVFMRTHNGDIFVGFRRAKRGIGGPLNYFSSDNAIEGNPESAEFQRENQNGSANGNLDGRVTAESFSEAVSLAARGCPFEVVYYPRGKNPVFIVTASAFRDAMLIPWQQGMRFRMAHETEDSSRISWFLGTISAVQPVDPVRWPNSPWRIIQVKWDEPNLLQHVKCVCPWWLEWISDLSLVNSPPFSLPIKKMRISQPQNLPLISQIQMSPFFGNQEVLCYTPNNVPVGIQGARHARFALHSRDIHYDIALPGPSSSNSKQAITATPPNVAIGNSNVSSFKTDDESCSLNVENLNQSSKGKDKVNIHQIQLFGQAIHTEKEHSAISLNGPIKIQGLPSDKEQRTQNTRTNQCKLFISTEEDVGHTIDLSVFGCYEELYTMLADILGMECSDIANKLLYQDESGAINRAVEGNFSELLKTARKLTIVLDSRGGNARTGQNS